MRPDRDRCPCGAGHSYAQCCGIRHAGSPARNAEQLMRSRYTAFVLCNGRYLLTTWHPSRRPVEIDFAADQTWLGLTVIETRSTGTDSAEVGFIARSRIGASTEIRHHELSRFVREDGVWWYVTGLLT